MKLSAETNGSKPDNPERPRCRVPMGDVGANSAVYLVRPGIAEEIGKRHQYTIRNGRGAATGPVLMHGHLYDQDCLGSDHWLVTADAISLIDTMATAVPVAPDGGLTRSESDPTDEHTEDVSLLKYTLRCAREEIVRLREENAKLDAALAEATGPVVTEPPSVSTGDAANTVGVLLSSMFAKMPSRAHEGDAGFDLYVSRPETIQPGTFVDVHCDTAIQLPPTMWGFVVGRSSTIRNRGLLVTPGIIDSGYRGELYAGVWNLTDKPVDVLGGERLAQFLPMPLLADGLQLVQRAELDDHARGEKGLGSTGV